MSESCTSRNKWRRLNEGKHFIDLVGLQSITGVLPSFPTHEPDLYPALACFEAFISPICPSALDDKCQSQTSTSHLSPKHADGR